MIEIERKEGSHTCYKWSFMKMQHGIKMRWRMKYVEEKVIEIENV